MITSKRRPIRVIVLGGAGIETPTASIGPSAETVFAVGLYLALENSRRVLRRRLQSMVWPDASQTIASHRLRQTILRLKKVGFEIDATGISQIAITNDVVVDIDEFHIDKGTYSNEVFSLFGGYEPRFSPAFAEWIDLKKKEYSTRLHHLLLTDISQYRRTAQWAHVETRSRQLLHLSPYNEEATLALAEAHAMRGAKVEALQILDSYVNDIQSSPTDLKIPATVLRRRIADKLPLRDQSEVDTPLIGRADLLGKMVGILEEAPSARNTCIVFGEAGIGKTRALIEFARVASLRGTRSIWVKCRSRDKSRPLGTIIDLVPSLRSLRGAIGCAPETVLLLDRLTKHKVGAARVEQEFDAELVYAKLENALCDLVEAVTDDNSLLVVIEDVQWIDPLSLTLLSRLIEWCSERRITFTLSTRDDPLTTLTQLAGAEIIEIGPLDRAASIEIIQSVLRGVGRTANPRYLDWCVRVADGNPFFLEELAKQAIEAGEDTQAPPSLTQVIDGRIARLSPGSVQLLQVSAMLGRLATFDRIERVLGLPAHSLLTSINELDRAAMLLREERDLAETGAFTLQPRHDLIAGAAVRQLSAPAKTFLHRCIATCLEPEIDSEVSTSVLWECALHWQHAGDSGRALRLAQSCGNHLMDVGLPSAAAEAFDRALAFCSNSGETIDVLRLQAKAFERNSDWSAVLKIESAARALASQSDSRLDVHDDLELAALRARWKTGDVHATRERLLYCLHSADASPQHRAMAGAMALMLEDTTCQYDEMRPTYNAIRGIAGGPVIPPATLMEADMVFHTTIGSIDAGVECAETLVRLERSKEDGSLLFRHLCNASVTYRTAGLFAEAKGCLQEAVAIADKHRMPKSKMRALPMLAHLDLEIGDQQGARRSYAALQEFDRHCDDVFVSRDLAALDLRIALLDANYDGITAYLRLDKFDFENAVRSPSSAYSMALNIAAELATSGVADKTKVAHLHQMHLETRRSLAQAFVCYVLCKSLGAIGDDEVAKVVLAEYLGRYRRETWMPTELFNQLEVQLSAQKLIS